MNQELIKFAHEIKYLPSECTSLVCDCCGGENIADSSCIYYDKDFHLCEVCYREIDFIMQVNKIGKYSDK